MWSGTPALLLVVTQSGSMLPPLRRRPIPVGSTAGGLTVNVGQTDA